MSKVTRMQECIEINARTLNRAREMLSMSRAKDQANYWADIVKSYERAEKRLQQQLKNLQELEKRGKK